MKRILLSLCSMFFCAVGFAEGYQVNTLSTRQLGMGHTGTGLKLGAESMLFNPAGLAFMDHTIDISAGVTAVSPKGTATTDGVKYATRNHVSTPFYFYAGFKIYDNLKAGVSLNTPYGSSIDWTDNWPGAVLNQNVTLTSYNVQPTIAWQITPKLAIGVGAMIAWGKIDLNKGLVNASTVDYLLAANGSQYSFGDITPASVNLTGTANLSAGINAGVMYDISKRLTVGASFKSKMKMTVKAGDAKITYANQVAEQLLESSVGVLNKANFSATMPMPYVLSLGTNYRPIDKLTLAFDAQLTGWKTYKTLTIDFATEKLKALNQYLSKNYHNAWAFRVGGQYALTQRMDLRAGFSYDNTPVDKSYYNPETPGMDKISPSVGFSFRPISKLSIDIAYSYIIGLNAKNASYTYEDLLFKSKPELGKSPEQTFTADYTTRAWCLAIGLRYTL